MRTPGDVGVEVADVHRGAWHIAGAAPFAFEMRQWFASFEAQHPGLGGVVGATDDIETAAELLVGEQTDRLLAQGAVVADLYGFEQVAGQLTEPVG